MDCVQLCFQLLLYIGLAILALSLSQLKIASLPYILEEVSVLFSTIRQLGKGASDGSDIIYQFTFAPNSPKSDISGALGPIHYITLQSFCNGTGGWDMLNMFWVSQNGPMLSLKNLLFHCGSPDFLLDFFL